MNKVKGTNIIFGIINLFLGIIIFTDKQVLGVIDKNPLLFWITLFTFTVLSVMINIIRWEQYSSPYNTQGKGSKK